MQGKPLEAVCPVCASLGMVKDPSLADAQYIYGQMIKCPVCKEAERRYWLVSHCGMEGAMLDVRLAGWQGGSWAGESAAEVKRRQQQRQDAYLRIRRAIKDRHGLFTFYGDFGAGKTHALAVVCNELRDALVETYYAPLASILDHLRTLYGQKADTSAYWQRLLDVPVLALDEVSRFNATDWAREKLFVLADTRYRRRDSHLTLFATNDDPHEGDNYLYSRMRQKGNVLVELRGDVRSAA